MMQLFKRIFYRADRIAKDSVDQDRQIFQPQLTWYSDTTMPIVDWRVAHQEAKQCQDEAALGSYWRSAAVTWLKALRMHLGEHYNIEQSQSFAMLSSLKGKQLQLAVEFCERSRHRILKALSGVASAWGNGPHVVLVFDTIDEYYDYVGNYYPASGEFAMSSGMFIQRGYGHFVFVLSEIAVMEPIIAHELTHCLIAPLAIPAWLNEGTAVNMERQIVPLYRDPRRGIFSHREDEQKRAEFWNANTIQQFWSGKSFLRPDEGCSLSYDLATELTRLIARDYEKYRAYMNSANRTDSGGAAALSVLGFSLGDLATAVLGEGEWEPNPACWQEGTERGQF